MTISGILITASLGIKAWIYDVMNSTHIGSLIVDEIETVYKNSFFDYRDITNIDFMIAVDMSSSVKHSSHSNLRNP